MARIVFAFALNNEGIFSNNYFGDADKFAIYEFIKGEIKFIEEIPNGIKKSHNKDDFDLEERKNIIVSLLKSKSVSVLVSRQFSQHLRKVNDDFVPVLIQKEEPEKVLNILNKNIRWIKDELKNKKSNHSLFQIKTGVLKTTVG